MLSLLRVRIIGVIDLLRSGAVHARAGARREYAPVEQVAGRRIRPGHALDLAQAYVEGLGISELYVADLDAILNGSPNSRVTSELASLGVPLWLDAGIRSHDEARRALDLGAAHVVVGLETLPSFAALARICDGVRPSDGVRPHESGRIKGSDPIVAFSLDLRRGVPIVCDGGIIPATASIDEIVRSAVAAGAGATIVIDLARVGTSAGLDVALVERVRRVAPDTLLIAGGGIRRWDDVEQLAQSGCDAALVATALHSGAMSAADVARAGAISRPLKMPATRSPA